MRYDSFSLKSNTKVFDSIFRTMGISGDHQSLPTVGLLDLSTAAAIPCQHGSPRLSASLFRDSQSAKRDLSFHYFARLRCLT